MRSAPARTPSPSGFSPRRCEWGWPNTTEPCEPPSYARGTGNTHMHTPCGLCFHCGLCYARSALQLRGVQRGLTAKAAISAQIHPKSLFIGNPQLSAGCDQGENGKLRQRNEDALAGSFFPLSSVGSHGSNFCSWEKQKVHIFSHFKTQPNLCGRLKTSSFLGKAARCCARCQNEPNWEPFAFAQPQA